MVTKQEQFRPSLSLAELKTICDSLHTTSPGSALFKKLAVYYAKVNVGLNPPAYIAAKRESVEQRLGLEDGATEFIDKATVYQERLRQKQEIAPNTLTAQEQFELLASKAIAGTITEQEKEQGKKLEEELYGMDMGTFA